jgi:hypothetical protein
MADISSALENMTLENAPPPPTQHHVLNLIYLAIRLLPDGTSLHLARPTDCAHREQPRLGTYHLSAENLSFFHRFAVKPLARYLPQFEDGLNLLTINVLAAAAGHSHLECVSYLDAYGEVQHIVCLTVTWNAQDKDADIVQYRYELSDADLRRTFSQCGSQRVSLAGSTVQPRLSLFRPSISACPRTASCPRPHLCITARSSMGSILGHSAQRVRPRALHVAPPMSTRRR